MIRAGQSMEDMLKERTVLYEKYADVVIDETGYSIEDTVQAICASVG